MLNSYWNLVIFLYFLYGFYGVYSQYRIFESFDDDNEFTETPDTELLPEVSAVLLECPKNKKSWLSTHPSSTTCEPELMVNIRVNPSFHIDKLEKYLILDEVYDPIKQIKAKIMAPYLIEISRGEPVLMYPLEFSKSVKVEEKKPENANNDTITDSNKCYDKNDINKDHNDEPKKDTVTDKYNTNTIENDSTCSATSTTEHIPVTDKINETQCKDIIEGIEILSTTSMSPTMTTISSSTTTTTVRPCYQNIHHSLYTLGSQDEFDNKITTGHEPFNHIHRLNQLFSPITKMAENENELQLEKMYKTDIFPRPISVKKIVEIDEPYINQRNEHVSRYHKQPFAWNNILHISELNRNSKKNSNKKKKIYISHVGNKNSLSSTNIFDDIIRKVDTEEPTERQLKKYKLEQLGIIYPFKKLLKKINDNSKTEILPNDYDIDNIDYETNIEQRLHNENVKDQNDNKNIMKLDNLKIHSNQNNSPVLNNYQYNNNNNMEKYETCTNDRMIGQSFDPNTVKDDFELESKDNLSPTVIEYFANNPYRNIYSKIEDNMVEKSFNLKPKDDLEIENNILHDFYIKNNFQTHEADNQQRKLPVISLKNKRKSDSIIDVPEIDGNNAIYYHPFGDNYRQKRNKLNIEENTNNMKNEISNDYTNKNNHKFLSHIFGEKNLKFEEKLNLINLISNIDNSNYDDKKLNRELQRENMIYATPYQIPYEKHKRKRSFLFYDDMEIPDNVEENKSIYDHQLPVLLNNIGKANIDDGIQPCATCGGKGRKPKPPKSDPDIPADSYLNCNCRSQRTQYNSAKSPRTVANTWYSVYNMSAPLPFLTTRIRIFRKRYGTWWRIVPSITLNSLSGIFANENLSILFSSHVNIFQFEKSLQLKDHQLLIPNDNKNINTNDISQKLHNKTLPINENHENININNNKNTNKINNNKNYTTSNIIENIQLNNQHLDDMENSHNVDNLENVRNIFLDPERALAVDPALLTSDVLKVDSDFLRGLNKIHERCESIHSIQRKQNIRNIIWKGLFEQLRNTRNSNIELKNNTSIKKIADFGLFPTDMNTFQQCPNDKNHLCLNMLDERVPSFAIKVKMPFRENTILDFNKFKVKIARIITDATTKDVLQVSVDVINEGFRVQEFSICVCNCHTPCASSVRNTVKKTLIPRVGETVTFLLPLITETTHFKHKKINCQIIVSTEITNTDKIIHKDQNSILPISKDYSNITTVIEKRFLTNRTKSEKIVALRDMTIEPENRCLCIWKCKCHCIPKLETNVDYNVCQELDLKDQIKAGLVLYENIEFEDESKLNIADTDMSSSTLPTYQLENQSTESQSTYDDSTKITNKSKWNAVSKFFRNLTYKYYIRNALLLFLLMLFLGLLKAIFGLCCKCLDKWGYSYVQMGRNYKNSSKCRRFWINVFFFIIFPFLFWCKCFTPTEEDLLAASMEWPCSNDSNFVSDYIKDPNPSNRRVVHYTESDDEDVILTQHVDVRRCQSKEKKRMTGGFDIPALRCIPELNKMYDEDIFEDDNLIEDDFSTKYILNALAESRDSLRRISSRSDRSNKTDRKCNDTCNSNRSTADDLVCKLRSAQIVYRTFDHPLGGLRNIPSGFRYCFQGYFLPCVGSGYEFVNYNPLAQHRCLSNDGCQMRTLRPPAYLRSKDFGRYYINKYDVLHASDLTELPPVGVPCLNISIVRANNNIISSRNDSVDLSIAVVKSETSTLQSHDSNTNKERTPSDTQNSVVINETDTLNGISSLYDDYNNICDEDELDINIISD